MPKGINEFDSRAEELKRHHLERKDPCCVFQRFPIDFRMILREVKELQILDELSIRTEGVPCKNGRVSKAVAPRLKVSQTITKMQGDQMQASTGKSSEETQKQPPALIVIGMAGSGKTTFMQVR